MNEWMFNNKIIFRMNEWMFNNKIIFRMNEWMFNDKIVFRMNEWMFNDKIVFRKYECLTTKLYFEWMNECLTTKLYFSQKAVLQWAASLRPPDQWPITWVRRRRSGVRVSSGPHLSNTCLTLQVCLSLLPLEQIPHGVDTLSCFPFQPVLHDWCNKSSWCNGSSDQSFIVDPLSYFSFQ